MTILCIWAWERFRPSVWKRLQKNNEKEKNGTLCVNFHWRKSSQHRQILQNSDEKQDCQFWILRLVVFTRFPANRDCLLKPNMLVKSARTVSRELHWGKRLQWAYFVVNWGCCDNTLLLCKSCRHAAYHIIGVREGILLKWAEKLPWK